MALSKKKNNLLYIFIQVVIKGLLGELSTSKGNLKKTMHSYYLNKVELYLVSFTFKVDKVL